MTPVASSPGLRRRDLLIGLSACVTPLAGARAAVYPDHTVRVTVPYAAGGIADITIRIVADRLGAALGQAFIIDNLPGARLAQSAKAALAAAPDGYTLTFFTSGTPISVGLFKRLSYDPVKEFTPVSLLAVFDFLFAVPETSRFKTLGAFLEEGRTKPGSLTIGTISIGSTQNLSAELLRNLSKTNVRIVPYKSSPEVIVAALRGECDMIVEGYSALKPSLTSNQMRALASSGSKRSKVLPNIPTVSEEGVGGFAVDSWNALYAPASVPAETITRLNKAVVTALADDEVKSKLLDLGVEVKSSTPQAMADLMNAEITKWAEIIDKAGIPRQ